MPDEKRKIDLRLPKYKDLSEKGRLQFFREIGDKNVTGKF